MAEIEVLRMPSGVTVATHHLVEYGVSRTAGFLKLDYYSLKKRLERASTCGTSAAFVELPPVSLPVTSECVIELEDAAGSRIRV